MSQALHSGFDQITDNSVRGFSRAASMALDLDKLIVAFGDALAQEQATGHRCFAVDGNGERILLSQSRTTRHGLRKDVFTITFSVEMPDDEPLIVEVDCPEAPDRHRRARLHVLAVAYATHAAILIEAQDDDSRTGSPTPTERLCLLSLVDGLSYLDIAERLNVSAPAIGVYLRRAAARFGVASVREACAIAMDASTPKPSNS